MGRSISKPGVKSASFNFEHFFDLSPDLLCIAGFDGYFKKVNPAVSKTLGFSEAELFAKPIDDFVFMDDRYVTAKKRELIKENKPLLNFENRYLTKRGDIVWLSWTSMPIDDEKLVFAIAKNITHKKKMEASRNLLLTNLTKVNAELKQLTYSTAHDLRLPVGNLLAIFNLLDTSKIQDEEVLEFIQLLKISTESLKETLNTYVDTLTQKDGLKTKVEDVDLKDCLKMVVESLASLLQNTHTSIKVDFSAFSTVQFNRGYMESILLNLITNAIKYAKHDSTPVISIFTKIENDAKHLLFRDEGLGFDMVKVKDKIFGLSQKFHQHADSKGIGLYLVHNHVTSLGGHIRVESRLNEGTTFIITF